MYDLDCGSSGAPGRTGCVPRSRESLGPRSPKVGKVAAGRRGHVGVLALVSCLFGAAAGSGQQGPDHVSVSSSVWSVDLRSNGYDPKNSVRFDTQLRLNLFHGDVAFLSDRELVVTFITGQSAASGKETSSPDLVLHGIELDAASGSVLRHVAWPTQYAQSALFARADGTIAVLLGDRIQFYSADLKFRSELDLSPGPREGFGDNLWFSTSPTGRTVLAQYGTRGENRCVTVRDETIAAGGKCSWPTTHRVCARGDEHCAYAVVSDEDVAILVRDKNQGRWSHEIWISASGEPWRKLCTGPGWQACNNPEFTSDDTLLLSPGVSANFRLLRDDGRALFGGSTFGDLVVNYYLAARGLFVVPDFIRERDKAHEENLVQFGIYDSDGPYAMPPFGSAKVFSVSARKQIFEVRAGKNDDVQNLQSLAISPGASRLVMEADGIVRCYNLPLHSK